jgi:uncharacterized protein YgiM (DUF1202 family)
MKYTPLIPLIALTQPAIALADSKWQTADVTDAGKLYAEPSTDAKIVGTLNEGEQYRVIKKGRKSGEDDWCLIETKSGKQGWILLGCFLTSACVYARGLGDYCLELTVLRKFRDLYVASFAEGREAIKEYYSFAPAVVAAINRSKQADKVYGEIYTDLVMPSVRLIFDRAFDSAFQHYKHVSLELRRVWLNS